ncbi:MAG: hypothetical protein P3W97_000500, partial [Tepidimonas sp.]|uniref:hypothetical protein n=1 Tax=Tepidimonas sp. TaxID=2002775 RepID=UPI00259DF483
RGSTIDRPRAPIPPSGFPAYAGIDPHGAGSIPVIPGLPRVRGDRPRAWYIKPTRPQASPRTRGSTFEAHFRSLGLEGFPAYEGIDLYAVRFDGIEWLGPDHETIARQIEVISRTKMIDFGLRRHAQRVAITTQSNKYDDYWRSVNKNFTRSAASAAEKQVVIYNSGPLSMDILAHKYGHLLAESITGSAQYVPTDLEAASKFDGFVSQYAMDMFNTTGYSENFAEACAAWQYRSNWLKRNYPNIFRVTDSIIRRARGARGSS